MPSASPLIYFALVLLAVIVVVLLMVIVSLKSHAEEIAETTENSAFDIQGYKSLYFFLNQIIHNVGKGDQVRFFTNSFLHSLSNYAGFSVLGTIYVENSNLYLSVLASSKITDPAYKELLRLTVEYYSKMYKIDVSNLNLMETRDNLTYPSSVVPDISKNIVFSSQKALATNVLFFGVSESGEKKKSFKKLALLCTEDFLNFHNAIGSYTNSNVALSSFIFDHFDSGVLIIKKSKSVAYINSIAKDYLGIKEESQDLSRLLKNLSPEAKKSLNNAIESKDKSVKFINKTKTLKAKIIVIDKDTTFVGIEDISSQEKLKRVREDNTNMMVHDLRAPLTVIKDAADILIRRDKQLKKSQKEEMLVDMKGSAQSLLNSVNNLLDVAKIESDEFVVNKNLQDYGKFVETKSEHFRSTIENRGIKFRVKVPKEDVYAQFDPVLLERVLNNLISNANKYTKKGSIKVVMEVINKKATVSIIDTGIGMNAKRQKELFQKFIQAGKPVSKSFKSTGLGLVIAKSIVEKHGGEVTVKSSEGKGSTFTFTLPLSKK